MRNWKKQVLGGVCAAAMLVTLVPATAMAADSSCSVNFEVNGAIVEYADGVKPGATCDVTIAKAVSILGDTLSVPEGKLIDHWTLNGTRIYTGAPIDAPELQGQTLVASLKDAPTYNFIVHTNGGEIVDGENAGQLGDLFYQFKEGETFLNKLPKLSKLDFVFKGWTYENGKAVKATDKATANTEVFAKWEPAEVDPGMQVKTFTLTVSTNGGEIASGEFKGLSGDVPYTVGQNEKLGNVLPKVTSKDLVFKGWSYDKAGQSKVLDSDFISADTQVYAQWEPAEVDPGMQVTQYNVVYNLNGGHFRGSSVVGDFSVQVAEGDTLLDKLPSSSKFVREGYKFVGWVYSETGKRVKATDTVNGNIYKVVAKWQKKAWWEFPWWEPDVPDYPDVPSTPSTPSTPSVKKAPIYRLYNPTTGRHLYTADENERTVLSTQRGWTDEGVVFYATTDKNAAGAQPVYRLRKDGNFLYTADENERTVLSTQRGWTDEGVAWYQVSNGTVPVYRMYSSAKGEHLYTTDLNEYAVNATRGWTQEGVAWKGL